MIKLDRADLHSIDDASKVGVSALVRAAEDGHDQVVLRDSTPVAAVISIARMERLQGIEDDLLDASLAVARMLTTGPDRHPLDQLLAQFGYTREQLAELPD